MGKTQNNIPYSTSTLAPGRRLSSDFRPIPDRFDGSGAQELIEKLNESEKSFYIEDLMRIALIVKGVSPWKLETEEHQKRHAYFDSLSGKLYWFDKKTKTVWASPANPHYAFNAAKPRYSSYPKLSLAGGGSITEGPEESAREAQIAALLYKRNNHFRRAKKFLNLAAYYSSLPSGGQQQ